MNKRVLFVILGAILLGVVGFGAYYYFASEDKTTTLTRIEKEWIENNKQSLIDLGFSNDIPVLNYIGEGLVFDFFADLEKNTELEFNRISYSYKDQIDQKYNFRMVKNLSSNQIKIYEDDYVLLTTESKKYNNVKEIEHLKIGVLESDLSEIKAYLSHCKDCEIVSFKDVEELINNLLGNEALSIQSTINAVIAPQLLLLKHSFNSKIHTAYLIDDIHINYVVSLGEIDKLNNIIKKFYKKWSLENFDSKFNKYFTDSYFDFSAVDQNSVAAFKGKRYVYGYVENAPYDLNISSDLYGTNKAILDDFSNIADIEIIYEKYENIDAMLKAFDKGNIDIFYNNTYKTGYDLNGYVVNSVYDNKIAIISNKNITENINSIKALKGKRVATLKSTNVSTLIKENTNKSVEYSNIKELMKSKENIIALDFNTYHYYYQNKLKDYKLEYIYENENGSSFTLKSVTNNEVFNKYFDFYLKAMSQNEEIGLGMNQLISKNNQRQLLKKTLLISGFSLVFIASILITLQMNRSKKPSISFKKSEKIKYMDILTSLKNRNYLNDNIDKWEESRVYPKCVIIVDLNNIAYINDNYGHNAGDEEIKEAANVLIKNQVINSDIVRTNGNEFLVYLVGYKEKQIELYIKKLNKELKELAHGFGAAIGYSMILDDIKTIDDAINEATIAMRHIKEEENDQKDL